MPTVNTKAAPQKSRSDTHNQRFPTPGTPFACNLCLERFISLYSVQQHFNSICFRKHRRQFPRAQWNDHPSCLTQAAALALPCARPFYPFWQVHNTATGEIKFVWPALSGWLTSPAELARKNAAHLATPGANPYFVDTQVNVYADVAGEQEEDVAGEAPLEQLWSFIQVVDERSVGFLLKMVETGAWEHGWADDVFFAVALHLSEERVVELLGCGVGMVRKWFVQAERAVFREHVRVGGVKGLPEDGMVQVEEQEERWRLAVEEFVARRRKGRQRKWGRLPCCDGERIERALEQAVTASSSGDDGSTLGDELDAENGSQK